MKNLILAAAALAGLWLCEPARLACADGAPVVASSVSVKISDEARAAAESIFDDRCAVCHGPDGDGKGPGAANLNPKPVNFRDRKWQRSVTDRKMTQIIIFGGPSVGMSASMAANPDLETQPGVVAALVEHIRKLGK